MAPADCLDFMSAKTIPAAKTAFQACQPATGCFCAYPPAHAIAPPEKATSVSVSAQLLLASWADRETPMPRDVTTPPRR